MNNKTKTALITLMLLPPLIAGCGTTETRPPEAEKPSALFYPPLPNPPRIQYLTSFSKESDIAVKKDGFAKFVLGEKEQSEREIEKPYGVALYDGKIYAVDTRGPGYVIFDLVNRQYRVVFGGGGGAMRKPINIVIDEDGNKYITDTQREQVLVFDREERFLRAFGEEGQFKPGDVEIVDNRLFVSDLAHHNIQVLDKETGELLYKFGSVGAEPGFLMYPTNLAVGPDNRLYISDTGNFRLDVYTLEGDYIRSYGGLGRALGQFARPKGVTVDRDGRIHVVDAAFQTIQMFAPDGHLLLFYGEPGNEPGQLNLPTDVEIDYENAGVFQSYAAPGFQLEYVILVANQFGPNKITVYGFGRMKGMEYP
ncbi:MAG TPA: hypothetical protein ENK54_09480 [Thiotrichales bacterium]|nr:hypothetical protein [Thiotrichales bacterium]